MTFYDIFIQKFLAITTQVQLMSLTPDMRRCPPLPQTAYGLERGLSPG